MSPTNRTTGEGSAKKTSAPSSHKKSDSASSGNSQSSRATNASVRGLAPNSSGSDSDIDRTRDSTKARYAGSSTTKSSQGSKGTQSTKSGFSNFSETGDPALYISNSSQPINPPSSEKVRRQTGMLKEDKRIQYGEYDRNRTSTSTYPTNPQEERDFYRRGIEGGVPAGTPMARDFEQYKNADLDAGAKIKEANRHRSEGAGQPSKQEMKANKKAPADEKKFRGAPLGTEEYHREGVVRTTAAANASTSSAEGRKRTSEKYVATDTLDGFRGHRERIDGNRNAAANQEKNRAGHQSAVDSFAASRARQGEASSSRQLSDRLEGMDLNDSRQSRKPEKAPKKSSRTASEIRRDEESRRREREAREDPKNKGKKRSSNQG